MNNTFLYRMVILVTSSCFTTALADTLPAYSSERTTTYETPDLPAHEALKEAFSAWFSLANREPIKRLGFVTQDRQNSEGVIDKYRGWGTYWRRPKAKRNWMIQAPHQFSDVDTGKIAQQLFDVSQAKVLALNTAQRNTNPHADLARGRFSPFNALTRAAAQTFEPSLVIQVHGFSRSKRKTEAARTASIIISDGTGWPDIGLQSVASCLSERWPTLRYPADTQELGATTNRQGQILRELGRRQFLHLELSRPVRDQLTTSPEASVFLSQCLDSYFPH